MDIKNCNLCDLKGLGFAYPRIKRGKGKKVMIIGEAPGKNEAQFHISFVGKSGKELDRWISYMELDNYYITNVVKHRPVDDLHDRPPTKTEISSCSVFLLTEIEREKPELIITLGNSSSHALGSKLPISKSIDYYIEKPHYYMAQGNIRILTFFHPSYVLRKKNDKGYNEFETKLIKYLDKIKSIINHV